MSGGRIELSARRRNRDVEIAVRDTGIGIARKCCRVIFDLFTQLDHRMGRPQSGLGIGLALVRRLVEMHGGTVSAASSGAGLGSEFVIRLPISLERVDRSTEQHTIDCGACVVPSAAWNAEPRAGTDPATQRRILVADDNLDALESLATLLALNGHEVFRAGDGAEAMAAAERHRPEIALLDIGMPRANGYEVARHVRSQPWGRSMVLVALTGWVQDYDRRRSKEEGFDTHLTNPVDPNVLNELLLRARPTV